MSLKPSNFKVLPIGQIPVVFKAFLSANPKLLKFNLVHLVVIACGRVFLHK